MAREIKKIAVLGAGTMGPGIAQIFALAGAEVAMYDIAGSALDKARSTLRSNLETYAKMGEIAPSDVDELYNRVTTYTTDISAALEGADMVMEAVVEKKEVKESVYERLDELLQEDAIIASNTSFLNIFELMPEGRLSHTVIAHWYSPPQMIPLVEICPNERTLPGITEAVAALLKKGGKNPVVMKKFIRGYIVNRLQMCLNQEVYYLLDNGFCTPEDIDVAIKSSFVPRAMVLGIMQKTDFGGLNMTANNYRNRSYTMPPEVDMPTILREHIERGETGVASGKGFYDYTGRDINELSAKRDEQLFKAFRLEKELMDDPII